MASSYSFLLLSFFLSCSLLHLSSAASHLTALVEEQPLPMTYHKGRLLTGPISVHLIWYGKFTPSQRAVISDFFTSLSTSSAKCASPSVSTWFGTLQKYYSTARTRTPKLTLAPKQILDESYSLGRSLTDRHIAALAAKGGDKYAINVVLTADDVAVDGFCMSRCGTHGSSPRSRTMGSRYAYIWVGNSMTQCPGQCAWPFHQPIYGPQSPPLVAPNGDVGVDGMVVTLAGMLAGTVTNPFGNGFFQGPKEGPLEAASACSGVYGKGAYPGYAGELLVDKETGASYNAHGVHGRKYLLPAVFDPSTASCSTLV